MYESCSQTAISRRVEPQRHATGAPLLLAAEVLMAEAPGVATAWAREVARAVPTSADLTRHALLSWIPALATAPAPPTMVVRHTLLATAAHTLRIATPASVMLPHMNWTL